MKDGYGNEVEYCETVVLRDKLARAKWLRGDTIQVRNKEGCVIATYKVKA